MVLVRLLGSCLTILPLVRIFQENISLLWKCHIQVLSRLQITMLPKECHFRAKLHYVGDWLILCSNVTLMYYCLYSEYHSSLLCSIPCVSIEVTQGMKMKFYLNRFLFSHVHQLMLIVCREGYCSICSSDITKSWIFVRAQVESLLHQNLDSRWLW